MTEHPGPTAFDEFAQNYDQAINRGLWVTGQPKEHFARERLRHVRERIDELGFEVRSILDFGCGTGTATTFFVEFFRGAAITGVDVSAAELTLAKQQCADLPATFHHTRDLTPQGTFDFAYCNGVFHHIPPADRRAALSYIRESLRPDSLFAFWENNPWNPGTRYIMSRIPFDRDAQTLAPPAARELLVQAGFHVLRTDYLFFFPNAARVLKEFERHLRRVPLGAQYLLLASNGERPVRRPTVERQATLPISREP